MQNETKRETDQEVVSEETTEEVEEVEQSADEDVVEAEAEVIEPEDESSSTVQQELEQKLEETTNRMLRLQADYDNFRRRTQQEKESAAKYRSQSLAESLLPALDNFERGMKIDAQSDETKSLLQGMEMVYRQMKEALKNEGIEAIDSVGQPFDPHVHQAVMQVESDEYEPNVVVEEMQKGYMLKDRVIRPAMVKVNA
ncbi:nucleotide exchange factor GrpE [Salipaludibacillus daqingensis]|uniref:nucleotide exchange factor GrpE n=1 Tax=Salipaludibacillus daqingensis TaxID=3041001 RepID=UPI0024753F9F|nr:nucleotide exchange factor GrpE [Salipaludibacillus daqingensis]